MSTIQTVRGQIPLESLGITLAHEHLVIDVSVYYRSLVSEPLDSLQVEMRDKPVTKETAELLQKNPLLQLDNLRLNDIKLVAEELSAFKKLGGKSIVDVTTRDLGRDVKAVRTVSELAGLNIVVATGWYVAPSHPPEIARSTKDELAHIMVKELTEGIDDSGIRAGIIKCAVGGITGNPTDPIDKRKMHPNEEKVMRAVGRAQGSTGACVTLHPCVFKRDFGHYMDIVEAEGANLSRFCMAHMDNVYPSIDLEACRSILNRSAYISLDTFGHNSDIGYFGEPSLVTDEERIQSLVELCKVGYDKQIVLGHDVATKHRLTKYNGFGYGHIMRNILPQLRRRGISEGAVENMLVANPKRLLAY